jgi:predicted SpoU family rRNA methylase
MIPVYMHILFVMRMARILIPGNNFHYSHFLSHTNAQHCSSGFISVIPYAHVLNMIFKGRNLQTFYEDGKLKIIQKAEHIRNCAVGKKYVSS